MPTTVLGQIASIDLGAPATLMTFSSLAGDTDLQYMLRGRLLNNTGSAGVNFALQLNTDTTNGNYGYSRFYNAVVWLSVILLIGLGLALIPIAIQQMRSGG